MTTDDRLRRYAELVVRIGANVQPGQDVVLTDDQARYLGEVALVDGSSPIWQTGLVFSDTPFDENASCHIAYGRGIPPEALGPASADELLCAGGADVDVDGIDAGGSMRAVTPIGRGDAWSSRRLTEWPFVAPPSRFAA